MKAINKKQKGFTLIELMIVVAIIGVLSTIAIPAYQDYVIRSESASALATMKSILTPAELYVQENGNLLAEDEATTLTAIGISTNSNTLGLITVPVGGTTLVFTFGENSAVPQDTTVTYTRTAGEGWACEVSDAAIETTSCPADAG